MSDKKKPILSFSVFWFLFIWYAVAFFFWALAFWPVTEGTSDWLLNAQLVCFGTLDNGLPDTYGWVMLVCAPVTLFCAILTAWKRELQNLVSLFFSKQYSGAFVVFFALVTVFETSWVAYRVFQAKKLSNAIESSNDFSKLPENYPLIKKNAPDFTLTDQNSNVVTLSSFNGEIVYLTFAFSHCSSICPFLIKRIRKAADNCIAEKKRILIVSLDPWRERPKSLSAITKNMQLKEREHYLSGSVEEVNKVLDDYEIPRSRDAKSGEIIHPGLVYIIDRWGKIDYILNSPSIDWLTEAGDRASKLGNE